MKKEKLQPDYGPDQWPTLVHEHIQAHSIRLGQLVLQNLFFDVHLHLIL